ncbi:MAG TPA: hypothetical protein VG986_06940, partial [Pseudolabrys sp.]|nr:hypothetical protein [Pseudolabrys sp.]
MMVRPNRAMGGRMPAGVRATMLHLLTMMLALDLSTMISAFDLPTMISLSSALDLLAVMLSLDPLVGMTALDVPVVIAAPITPPVMAPGVEVAMTVVMTPISADRKADDGKARPHRIIWEQDTAAVIAELQAVRRRPAAFAVPTDIAPIVIGDAAMDIHIRAVGNGADNGKAAARSGTQTCRGRREARPSRSGGRKHDGCERNDNEYHLASHGECLPR